MIDSIWSSFKSNVREKSTNPILGTFAIVWIVRNWKLIFTLFNFDKGISLQKKLEMIQAYFAEYTIWQLFWTVGISIIVVIFTYFILAVSRFIVNTYDRIVKPWLYSITDKSSIVLKEEFDSISSQLSETQEKYLEERRNRMKAEFEKEQIEKELNDLKSRRATLSNHEFQQITDDKKNLTKADKILEILINESLEDKFKEVYSYSQAKYYMERSEARRFSDLGLIKWTTKMVSNNKYLAEVTKLGEEVYEKLIFG
jgi:hypothetical protein